jgi:Cof subfamily protein (haloacid dehalogenase superfamily)
MEATSQLKVLALDLDGTVLSAEYRISDRTVAAVRAAREGGLKLVVTTGRSREAALRWIERLGGADGAVCYNGAAVYETEADGLPRSEPLALSLLPEAPARAAVGISRRLDLHFHAFRGVDWLYERRYPETERYELRSGLVGVKVDFDAIEPLSFIKAMFLGPDELLARARVQALALGLDAFGSGHGLLELVAPGVDKARGLSAWLSSRGLRMAEVLAFGDADNDEAMLLQAGIGVAMGNAPEALRLRVGRETLSVDEDGVARWLELNLAATR